MSCKPERLGILKQERLEALITFVRREGWQVQFTLQGNIKLTREGFASIVNASYLLEHLQYGVRQIHFSPQFTCVEQSLNDNKGENRDE